MYRAETMVPCMAACMVEPEDKPRLHNQAPMKVLPIPKTTVMVDQDFRDPTCEVVCTTCKVIQTKHLGIQWVPRHRALVVAQSYNNSLETKGNTRQTDARANLGDELQETQAATDIRSIVRLGQKVPTPVSTLPLLLRRENGNLAIVEATEVHSERGHLTRHTCSKDIWSPILTIQPCLPRRGFLSVGAFLGMGKVQGRSGKMHRKSSARRANTTSESSFPTMVEGTSEIVGMYRTT